MCMLGQPFARCGVLLPHLGGELGPLATASMAVRRARFATRSCVPTSALQHNGPWPALTEVWARLSRAPLAGRCERKGEVREAAPGFLARWRTGLGWTADLLLARCSRLAAATQVSNTSGCRLALRLGCGLWRMVPAGWRAIDHSSRLAQGRGDRPQGRRPQTAARWRRRSGGEDLGEPIQGSRRPIAGAHRALGASSTSSRGSCSLDRRRFP